MRRLSVPTLRDRDQICVYVVIEIDHATECVGDGCNAAQRIVIDRDVVAVAILDFHTTPLVVDFSKN